MIKHLFLIFFLLSNLLVCGQEVHDRIIKKDKSEIEGDIIDISDDVVELDPIGDIPFITVKTSDISAIIYSNGKVKLFGEEKVIQNKFSKVFIANYGEKDEITDDEKLLPEIFTFENVQSPYIRPYRELVINKVNSVDLTFENTKGYSEDYKLEIKFVSTVAKSANLMGSVQYLKDPTFILTLKNRNEEIIKTYNIVFDDQYTVSSKGVIEKYKSSFDLVPGFKITPEIDAATKYIDHGTKILLRLNIYFENN